MSLPFFIARRYLFSKKSHNAINIISAIAAGGIALATAAMVCAVSVFNGFHDLISSLYCNFDPEIQVVATKGKSFAADDPLIVKMQQHPGIEVASTCLEDKALVLFQGSPLVITVKGVDDNFAHVTSIRDILYGEGTYRFEHAGSHYAIPGIGLSPKLRGLDSLQICAPRSGARINTSNPIESFSVEYLRIPNMVFNVHQRKYDENYLLTSLSFAQQLFEKDAQISTLELKVKPTADFDNVKADLTKIAADRFKVLDRLQQHEETFNIMNIEKFIAFLFLTFIVLIACFNIISSLSMLIIEKKEDVMTLRNLGLTSSRIRRIFLVEGRLISFFGAIVGIGIGVILCLLQEQFGLIRLGGGNGGFIVDSYPVSVHWQDIIITFVTVIFVGFVSVWYPVHALSKRFLQ